VRAVGRERLTARSEYCSPMWPVRARLTAPSRSGFRPLSSKTATSRRGPRSSSNGCGVDTARCRTRLPGRFHAYTLVYVCRPVPQPGHEHPPVTATAFAGLLGIHVHEAVIAAGVKVTGCTVHFVTNDLDAGQSSSSEPSRCLRPTMPRVLPRAFWWKNIKPTLRRCGLFCEHRLKVDGRRVRIAN